MQTTLPGRWARISAVNLFTLALLGVLLRYKTVFPLPAANYKYLLNAHSHFAFTGWVTSALYTSLLFMLAQSGFRLSWLYRLLFWLNQLSAYGMLVAFTCQGYGPVSIVFSALSVLVGYAFAILYWLDLGRTDWPSVVRASLRLALAFLVLSSAGPFLLMYSMSHAIGGMAFYYNAIYLFLHFQYNGWFSFGVIGVFFWFAWRRDWALPLRASGWFVGLMGAACVPAYCLSVLWTDPAFWVRAVAAIAALLQLAAFVVLVQLLRRRLRKSKAFRLSEMTARLWWVAVIAFGIKICLQALSAIPFFGTLAFGFRPVIIAYLHLVLLGFISLFVVAFLHETGMLALSLPGAKATLAFFAVGIVVNEVVLLVQALLGFAGRGWMNGPYFLFGAAIWLAIGAGGMAVRRASDIT